MALSDNPFLDLPIETLQTMKAEWLKVLSDIAGGGKSYTLPGRSMTQADMPEVRKTLAELRAAIRVGQGRGVQVAQARIDTQRQFSG